MNTNRQRKATARRLFGIVRNICETFDGTISYPNSKYDLNQYSFYVSDTKANVLYLENRLIEKLKEDGWAMAQDKKQYTASHPSLAAPALIEVHGSMRSDEEQILYFDFH